MAGHRAELEAPAAARADATGAPYDVRGPRVRGGVPARDPRAEGAIAVWLLFKELPHGAPPAKQREEPVVGEHRLPLLAIGETGKG